MAVEMSEGAHYYKYVGLEGKVFNIDKFGVSASGPVLIKEYGYTKENIAQVQSIIAREMGADIDDIHIMNK